MPRLDDQMLMALFGLVFLGMGLAARLDLWKGWYWRTRGGTYSYIPLGLLFFVYAWRAEITELFGTELAFYALFGLMIFLGVWWTFFPPAFIKPPWVRWIEEQPEDVQEAMRAQAEENDDWRSHVQSRQAVEEWARRIKNRRR